MRTEVTKSNSENAENSLNTDSVKGKPGDEPKVVLGVRRTLQSLQKTAGGDKENLVGAGGRSSMPPSKEKLTVLADSKPSKKLKGSEPKRGPADEDLKSRPRRVTAEDLTSDEPGTVYWEALAERRRIALADALEENQRLMGRIAILEEENSRANSRIALLEEENAQASSVLKEARETINILTELLNEKDDSTDIIDLDED